MVNHNRIEVEIKGVQFFTHVFCVTLSKNDGNIFFFSVFLYKRTKVMGKRWTVVNVQ